MVVLKSVLRFLWDYGKELTILVFAVVTYQSCNNVRKWKARELEMSNKVSILETEVRQRESVIQNNRRIYFEENKELEKVIDSLNIVKRKIQYVHSIRYRDTGSTRLRVVHDTIVKDSMIYPVITANYNKECHAAHIVYNPANDSLEYSYSNVIDLSIIGHWERDREFSVFGKRLFTYGPKNHFVTVHNNCGNSILLKNEFVDFRRR